MKALIKSNFKNVIFLPAYRNFLLITFFLSLLFSITFLFTIDITQGKKLVELTRFEVLDITLLGIDVVAIMLIIFTAIFIAKEFTTGAIYTSLAITPVRQKYFISKLLFITLLSFLISIVIILFIFGLNQLVLSIYDLERLSFFGEGLFIKLIGLTIMPIFYSLLSATAAFYTKSAAGGIAYGLGVMFLPALLKMFPANFSDIALAIFPETSLHLLMEINLSSLNGSFINALLILMLWIVISSLLGSWRLKKADF